VAKVGFKVKAVATSRLAAMAESWRPVCGGSYEVSDLGRVRNTITGYVKSVWVMPNGYHQVSLFHSTKAYVHRLVAEAFFGAAPPGANEVNHIDGDKANNRRENLHWVNHSANQRHAYRVLGTLKLNLPSLRGVSNSQAKLSEADVGQIKLMSVSVVLQRTIAAKFGISQSHVSRIVNGHVWAGTQ